MFAVIYRGHVKNGKETEYLECWKKIANHFVRECGAIGSTLHKSEDGMWVAYSKWPNKSKRDAAWPRDNDEINSKFPHEIQEAITRLKSCLDEERQLPEICMEVVEEIV